MIFRSLILVVMSVCLIFSCENKNGYWTSYDNRIDTLKPYLLPNLLDYLESQNIDSLALVSAEIISIKYLTPKVELEIKKHKYEYSNRSINNLIHLMDTSKVFQKLKHLINYDSARVLVMDTVNMKNKKIKKLDSLIHSGTMDSITFLGYMVTAEVTRSNAFDTATEIGKFGFREDHSIIPYRIKKGEVVIEKYKDF